MKIHVPGCRSVQNPAWSPDGRFLSLTDWRGGYNEGDARVIVFDLTTKEITVIAEGGVNVSQPGACWHATSGLIFSSDRWGDEDQIARARDGKIERLVRVDDHVGYEPTWAPNGNDFAFEQHRTGEEANGHIILSHVGGQGSLTYREPYVDITKAGDCRQPNWSNDGRIVYQKHEQGWWLFEHVVHSSQARRLVKGTDATWHPDGTLLYSDDDGRLRLLDTRTMHSIHVGPQHGYHGAASVSPDGRHIACEASDVDPDGGSGTWLEVFDL